MPATPATTVTGLTFGGDSWIPKFIRSIDHDLCIGCGRCFKSCGRSVLALCGLDDEGQLLTEGDDEDEIERHVMTIANQAACIGCESCSRACPRNCLSHAAKDA